MTVTLLELLHILLRDVLDILHVEQQTKPQFQLNLGLVILELLLPDLSDVQIMVEDAVDKLFTMFFGPVEALLGVEVGMIEGVVFVADLGAGQCASHELRVALVIYLRALHIIIVDM